MRLELNLRQSARVSAVMISQITLENWLAIWLQGMNATKEIRHDTRFTKMGILQKHTWELSWM